MRCLFSGKVANVLHEVGRVVATVELEGGSSAQLLLNNSAHVDALPPGARIVMEVSSPVPDKVIPIDRSA